MTQTFLSFNLFKDFMETAQRNIGACLRIKFAHRGDAFRNGKSSSLNFALANTDLCHKGKEPKLPVASVSSSV